MKIEVAVKIGDSNPGNFNPKQNYHDGMMVVWKPPGVFFSANSINAFFQSGTVLPLLNRLPLHRQEEILRDLAQMKYLTEVGSVEEAADQHIPSKARLDANGNAVHKVTNQILVLRKTLVQIATERIATAQKEKALLLSEGGDSNWGSKDLRSLGIMTVDVPTLGDLEDITAEPIDPTAHPFAPRQTLGKRRWKAPYEQLLSPDTTNKWKDKNLRVDLNRTANPFAWGQFKRDVSF